VQVVIVGDFDAASATHAATEESLRHAAAGLDAAVNVVWRATDEISADGGRSLGAADGMFLTTGSPYRSFEGALAAIRYARESGLPFLGTCGGFQHAVVEAFRNIAGIEDAAHGEYDPTAPHQVITAFACSLAGRAMQVHLVAGSCVADIYGCSDVVESYYCEFGIADAYRDRLDETGLAITGVDSEGEPRVIELPGHPFFLSTLFVPQARSTPDRPHPLISAFVRAATS
jgi:CTP synthase (UTP-ammonia lyase)